MTDNPLANLGELTKPATVLIEKISDAVGGIFRPHQIVRVAKAEAEAERVRAEAQIQLSDLHRRALRRFLEEEAKKQSNIEDITHKALPLLAEDSSPQDVANDWITNFFDKCRIVSDGDMQRLWSSVLASEANSPGAFSRRTVNLLTDLDKSDAELFMRLCGFAWQIGNVASLLVFNVDNEVYQRQGIDFGAVTHLESLGLVQFRHEGFRRTELPKTVSVHYYGNPADLTLSKDTDNEIDVGQVLLTRAGEELAPVCGSHPVEGFFDFVYDRWAARSLVPKRETGQDATGDG